MTLQQRIKITELKTSLETLNERKNYQKLSRAVEQQIVKQPLHDFLEINSTSY